MPYSNEQLLALQKALATGEKRVSFGDKTVEYRSVDEIQAAIREVEASLARAAGARRTRQIRVTTDKGF
ncbi:MAG: hypothetical protein HT579_22215 [Candidatus Accumulibacter similis]|nr:MAG: hypothetical protein HT579_03810 [Candidatus Accumulibacter similis]QKS31399.1 MAG: hypothetical protein HT579_22215 [Candidatus Accumulibacter similis]